MNEAFLTYPTYTKTVSVDNIKAIVRLTEALSEEQLFDALMYACADSPDFPPSGFKIMTAAAELFHIERPKIGVSQYEYERTRSRAIKNWVSRRAMSSLGEHIKQLKAGS